MEEFVQIINYQSLLNSQWYFSFTAILKVQFWEINWPLLSSCLGTTITIDEQLLAEMTQSIPHWLELQVSVSSAQGNWWHSTLRHACALKVTKSKLTSLSHEEEFSSKHCLKQWAWENPYSDHESHRGEMI